MNLSLLSALAACPLGADMGTASSFPPRPLRPLGTRAGLPQESQGSPRGQPPGQTALRGWRAVASGVRPSREQRAVPGSHPTASTPSGLGQGSAPTPEPAQAETPIPRSHAGQCLRDSSILTASYSGVPLPKASSGNQTSGNQGQAEKRVPTSRSMQDLDGKSPTEFRGCPSGTPRGRVRLCRPAGPVRALGPEGPDHQQPRKGCFNA